MEANGEFGSEKHPEERLDLHLIFLTIKPTKYNEHSN